MNESGALANSFAEFIRAQTGTLYGTALLLTGSRDGAEELIQDTLTGLYPKWGRVQAADQPVAYVRRALTNRFLKQVRRSGRERPMWDLPEDAGSVDVAEQVLVVGIALGHQGFSSQQPYRPPALLPSPASTGQTSTRQPTAERIRGATGTPALPTASVEIRSITPPWLKTQPAASGTPAQFHGRGRVRDEPPSGWRCWYAASVRANACRGSPLDAGKACQRRAFG